MDLSDAISIRTLDGGLSTELQARGHDLSDHLWSARLLIDDPAVIVAAHVAFYRAGASVATTATYQASFDGFARRGVDYGQAELMFRRGVELAQQARAELAEDGHQRWVAASIGPYGAALADGSEYRGRYGLSVGELTDWHRPRLSVLADAGADVLACETVPDVDEAEALVAVLGEIGTAAWLSYTVEGGRTRAGQPLDEAFGLVAASREVIAVGVNCCSPVEVGPAIEVARAVTDKPVIVYPNSGEQWDGKWSGSSAFTAGMAREWVAAGATAVGGCCRVTPQQIAELAAVLDETKS
ncbi:homocysteine S-methyltransferase [Actinokineospora cianjurensis]|uniref:Homocysteine S-methyltransferase n=1 Tax=Actinokineospora cianjurensis TaxID=585224 RepID=A0A421BC30_9PSEU|nr:homocysteine S-methyltransferase [Actinokineospora cianjurensis]RLK61903.1 homocysteine S-methyltransferase [Actinokineospora cianjurensis]